MNELRSKLKFVLFFILVLVIAFVGVLSGSYFIDWKNTTVEAENLQNQAPVIKTDFNMSESFPNVELIDINGELISTNNFIHQAHSVIIFLTPGCEPCANAITYWKSYKDEIPKGFQVIGICQSDFDTGNSYIIEYEFPFPVYFDTTYYFSTNHNVNQFPNVMGLYKDGTIAFLNRGIYNNFTPINACELIMNSQI